MKMRDAIAASQISAARGYDKDNKCVVSVAHYGGGLMWLTGWGGNWAKTWAKPKEEDLPKLEVLTFKPSGPKPEALLEDEITAALTEINEADHEDNIDPIGEAEDAV